MAGRIEQFKVEVLQEGTPAARVEQFKVEVLQNGSPAARIEQFVVEVLVPNKLTEEVGVLVFASSTPDVTTGESIPVSILNLASSLPSITLEYTLSLATIDLISSTPAITITGGSVSLETLSLVSSLVAITQEYGLSVSVLSLPSSLPEINDEIGVIFLPVLNLASSTPQPFSGLPAIGDYFLSYIRQSGSNYNLVYRTSSDFISWSGETVVTPGGLDATRTKYNVSVFQEGMGDIFLFFDVVDETDPASNTELINIYYTRSVDGGLTWSNAVQVTNYTTFGTAGTHPRVVQKVAGEMALVYTEEFPSLTIDHNADGFCGSVYMYVGDMHFDSVTRRLYAICNYNSFLDCVLEIDVDAWEILNCWNTASTPSFNDIFGERFVRTQRNHGERHFVPVSINHPGNSSRHIALLNAQTDSIRHYYFEDNETYLITQNVDWTPLSETNFYLSAVWLDFDSNRLYALFVSSSISHRVIQVGYLDITDDEDNYDFTDVVTMEYEGYPEDDYDFPTEENMVNHWISPFLIVPEEDYIIISFSHSYRGTTWKGRLMIFDITSGGLIRDYVYSQEGGSSTKTTSFPYHGLTSACYLNGKIYGGFTYDTIFDEETKRGLCIIDLTTSIITYSIPSSETHNDYRFTEIIAIDEERLLISSRYGIYIFNTLSLSWTLYNNDTVPGLAPSNNRSFGNVAYDSEEEKIFAGVSSDAPYSTWYGIAMFSENGFMKHSQYMVAEYGGSWVWGDAEDWVQGEVDYDASVSVAGGSYFTFWINENLITDELSIVWDAEIEALDLTQYLVKNEDISIQRSIDGSPAKLSFTLSHGHLFDPHNNNSLLRQYVTRYRVLTVRFGERINDENIWVNQGSFIVTEIKLAYQKGEYPVLEVSAEDRRVLWQEHEIVATDFYDDYPEPIIRDLLETFVNLDEENVDIVDFDIRETIYIQWIDTAFKEILDQIVNRFGYFFRMTVDDVFQTRKISDENNVDHVYSNSTSIIEFSPDDSYSDFTNQVIVTGEERAKIDVTHTEERITSMSGTIGWWGGTEEHTIYYSDDRSRRCRYPRLAKIRSTDSIGFDIQEFFGGQIDIYISETSPNDEWCRVVIEVPCLLPQLVAIVAMIPGTYFIGDPETGRQTIPYGSLTRAFLMFSALSILGSVVNYQFEVWANPVGKIRRSIQGEANDIEAQTNLGYEVTKKFDDALCFTVEGCNNVAEFELLIAQLQRRRVKFTKIAHLQDEEGDTIQILHPYTGQTLTVFITNITRKFKKPLIEDNKGYFIDEIEGWVL